MNIPKLPKDRIDYTYCPNCDKLAVAIILIIISFGTGIYVDLKPEIPYLEVLVLGSFAVFLLGIYLLIKSDG